MNQRNQGVFLEDFEIKSFRGISNYSLKNLSSFTSITGKNSSGKSSIIDALTFLGSNEMHQYSDIPGWYPSEKISYNDAEIILTYYFRLNQRFDELLTENKFVNCLFSWYSTLIDSNKGNNVEYINSLKKSYDSLQTKGSLKYIFQDALYEKIHQETMKYPFAKDSPDCSALFSKSGNIRNADEIFGDGKYLKLTFEIDFSNGPAYRYSLLDEKKKVIINEDLFYHMVNNQESINCMMTFGTVLGYVFIKSVTNSSNIISAENNPNMFLLRNGSNLKKYIEYCLLSNPLILKKVCEDFLDIFDISIHFKKDKICSQSDEQDILINLGESDYDFSIDKLSHGMRNILKIVLQVESAKEGEILVIDEPELHLHPGSAKRLRDILYRKKEEVQIICVTHSPIFLDTNFVNTIVLNENDDKNIHPKILKSDEIDKALSELGISGSDILLYDTIIWVEGPSDKIYLEKWLDLMKNELKRPPSSQIGILPYGGQNIDHLDIKMIKSINRNSIFIIDSDKSSDNDPISPKCQRFLDLCRDEKIYCWITERKEIENYISSDLLNKVLNIKEENAIKITKYDDVFALLKQRGRNFEERKSALAHSVTKKMRKEHIIKDKDFYSELIALMNELN